MAVEFSRALAKLVFPDKPRNVFARYLVAILLPLLSTAFTDYFFNISDAPFFPLFTLSVMFAAVYGGWDAGLVSTVVSVILNALSLPPRYSLLVRDVDDLGRLLVFAVGGIAVSAFIGTIGSLQRKLEIQRERYRVTLTSIGDAVMATDTDGRITFMNRVAEELTGWSWTDAAGVPLEEVFQIVNETTRATVANPVRKVFECGRIVGLANHTMLIRRDGTEIAIDDSAAPIRDVRGNTVGAVLVFRDITEQRRRDAALVHSEKLASVGRLAATIAHEINNPLEAVSNLLYLIGTTDNVAEAHQYAKTAEGELDRAAQSARQTLTFVRHEIKPEPVKVGAVVEAVLATYANKVRGKRVRVVTDCVKDAVAWTTRNEVRQVLGNVIGNALDAVSDGGAIRVKVRLCGWSGRQIARILVADSGHGIPPQHMPHLFAGFFSTKEGVGTGLGLWATKQILDANEGCVHIRSRVGRGTVVAICWPTAQERGVASVGG